MAMLLDRYYTPMRTADFLVEAAGGRSVRTCFDSNCGDGSLLEAAARRHRGVQCMGMDKNQDAIRRLRIKRPTWLLSAGDALTPGTWSRVKAAARSKECDLVTMNPPFSMNANKGIDFAIEEIELRCSVAMAHLLTTLTKTTPERCVAIVPESLLASDLDSEARAILERRHRMTVVAELKNSTFRGARANAVVLNLRRRARRIAAGPAEDRELVLECLVRGGLPVHEVMQSRRGLPFIHTTSLSALERGLDVRLPRVRSIARGIVSGHVILLPRVGVPLRPPTPIFLRQRVQLSDCVIAISFDTKRAAQLAARGIEARWTDFAVQWRGTGARYITVKNLSRWISDARIV